MPDPSQGNRLPQARAESELVAWLLDARQNEVDLVSGLATRLVDAGVPLWRMSTSFQTLHPEVRARNVTWSRETGTVVIVRPQAQMEDKDYVGGVIQAIHKGSPAIRCRLEGPREEIPWAPLRELAARGATDYLIAPLRLAGPIPTFVSFATTHPGGFEPSHLALLESILPVLRIRVEMACAYIATHSLLETYLGASAAARVLAGGFLRGGGEAIEALIWYCDMRGFTNLVDTQPAAEVVAMLDEYFDCVAGPFHEQGGEVLKFIGDAMLAILPLHRLESDPLTKALQAAEAAFDDLAARNARAKIPLALGLSLHAGTVTFGNIGSRTRLDFTVIGPAVNEAARIQGLCKELGVPLLISDTLVGERKRDLVSMGRHQLRGVREPHELFTLARFQKARP